MLCSRVLGSGVLNIVKSGPSARVGATRRSLASTSRTPRIALIPGDGIGTEIVPAAREVLESLGLEFKFVDLKAGFNTFQKTRSALPAQTLDELKKCDAALFGCVSSPKGSVEGYHSPIISIRKELDLYANLRPIVFTPTKVALPGTREVNMMIVRENTECLLVAKERVQDNGRTAIAERVITERASTRIARVAFAQAKRRHTIALEAAEIQARKGAAAVYVRQPAVTVVHKANVLAQTDGLFLSSAMNVSKAFPEVQVGDVTVDMMAFELVRTPERFDVVLAPNLYGDILQDLCTAFVGNLDLVPTANLGDKFILTHASNIVTPHQALYPKQANPLGAIRAAALILYHLGHDIPALAIERAVNTVLAHGPFTPDMQGNATTQEVVKAVIAHAQYVQHTDALSSNTA